MAALAGADPWTALRLGASMLGIQVSIGALNYLVDAPIDATQKRGKPIPRGLVSGRAARFVAIGGLVVGLLLSVPSGLATVAALAAAAGLGYAYDLRLSRTTLSWLPLSLALPLLPIHAWLGATGSIPSGLVTLVPAGVLAGAALALANGLVDLERDARVARRTIAVDLGPARTWAVHAGLLVIVAALAVFVAPGVPATPSPTGTGLPGTGELGLNLDTLRLLRNAGVMLGLALVGLGALALRSAHPSVRERGWELEAVGVASVGIGWLAGTAAAAGGGAGG